MKSIKQIACSQCPNDKDIGLTLFLALQAAHGSSHITPPQSFPTCVHQSSLNTARLHAGHCNINVGCDVSWSAHTNTILGNIATLVPLYPSTHAVIRWPPWILALLGLCGALSPPMSMLNRTMTKTEPSSHMQNTRSTIHNINNRNQTHRKQIQQTKQTKQNKTKLDHQNGMA